MKKERGPSLLGQQMERIYEGRGWQNPWQIFALVRDWESTVDPEIAARTMPAYLRRDVLWVYVRSSAMMQHVQMLKPRLIEQVNRRLQRLKIRDIRWLLQPADLPEIEEDSWQPAEVAPDPAREAAFRKMASTVADPECRQALCALWRSFQRGPDREKQSD